MKLEYKKTVLGLIPSDWSVIRIGELFPNLRTGSTPSRRIPDFFQGDILWITSGELNYNIIKDTKEKITAEAVKATNLTIYPPGTFFIAITGLEVAGTRGRCGINGIEATTNQSCMAFYENDKIKTEYLFHYYKNYGESWAFNLAQGTKQQSFNNKIIAAIQIPLPPLPEQQKIAEILSTMDEKMAVIDEQLAQTQELKKGLMQRLLTKGIGHTAFKDSSLGRIPNSWEVVRGEDISSLITKGASPGWQGFDYTEEGLLFVTSENVKEGRLDISKPKFLPVDFNKKVAKSQLKNGDILINIVGASIGRACIYESPYELANVNQAVCVLRSNSKASNSFLLHSLQSPDTIKRLLGTQAGSARQNLSLSDIRAFPVAIPPLPEQRQIAEILTTIDNKLQVLTDKKTQYQELKRGLMQQLLTGQRRVKRRQEEAALA